MFVECNTFLLLGILLFMYECYVIYLIVALFFCSAQWKVTAEGVRFRVHVVAQVWGRETSQVFKESNVVCS
jgi:hypothetical protein